MSNWLKFAFSPKNYSNTTMRKEQLKLRTDGNASAAPLTSDDSDIENESINKEQTSAGGDAFDSLLGSKTDDSTPKKTNGVTKVPSPVPDDSDTEKNDTETEGENEADTTELDGTTTEKAAAEENGDEKDEDADESKEEEQYEVEEIVGSRTRSKQTQYYIKWKNFPESQNTWEFESNVDCPELIAEYLEKNPNKAKKVRISLPATREAPKRSAAENKSLLESDQESGDDDDDAVKAKSPKKKTNAAKSPNARGRGRPKKGSTKSEPAQEEYEVEKIIDEKLEGGKKYFRIRWKGYGAKSDTWELKKSLNCPDKIKEYEDSKSDEVEYEVEKIMGEMIEKGKRLFYVKWKNWPESDNSWESEESVDCPDLIEKFRDSCRSVGKATKRPAAKVPVQTPKKAKKADKDEERDPLADEEESDEEELQWEVKQILDVRKRRGKKEYLIRWKNCDQSQDSWEPENGINCPELLAAFAKKKNK